MTQTKVQLLDLNGLEAALDADADTTITADTDDRIDFKAGGTDTLHVGNGVVTVGTTTNFGPTGFPTGVKVKGDVLIGDFTNDSIASTLCFIKSRNTTPGSQTIVNNGDEVGSIDFRADDGDDTGYNNNVARIAVAIDAAPGTNDTAGNITFSTTSDGARASTERMRIGSNGTIGIGTSSPSEVLHVVDGSSSCKIRASGEGNANKKVEIAYDSSDGPYLKAGSSGITTLKFFVDNTSLAMTIAANDVISGDFNDTSDVALKENIVDLESATEKLKQLKTRMFDWKKEGKSKEVAGFIAQEVESIIPSAVVGDDYVEATYYTESDDLPENTKVGDTKVSGNSGKAINASAILAYAVKTIQELEARIKTLEDA